MIKPYGANGFRNTRAPTYVITVVRMNATRTLNPSVAG
jgi:hypothetical protein